MRWRTVGFVLLAALPCRVGGPGAAAAETRAMSVEVANRTGEVLHCQAIAYHWYGFDLGGIEVGGHAELKFDVDPARGMASIANAAGVPVPLQFIYCGRDGDAWRTRAVLPLRRLIEDAGRAKPAGVDCRNEPGGLVCD